LENNENNVESELCNEPKLHGYKIVCVKLGLTMCVYFICRLLVALGISKFGDALGRLGETASGLISSVLIIIFIYIIPMLFAALIFKSFSNYKGKYRILYKKPRRLARALGTFPATFGLGHGIALLTLLVSYLILRHFSMPDYIEELFRPTVMEPTTNMVSVLTMVFMLVVIAPLFEEFLTRGIMYDALKPYGTGMAILISSLLFGLMHGSLYMLFYTTAYGLALGYIRYATDSLFTVTILHAIINAIAAVALLLTSLMEITGEGNRFVNTTFMIFIVAMLVMIIVGIVVFLAKIPAVRKFKIENSWTDIGGWKKTAWFFASVPVIIMMVLAVNELAGHWLLSLVIR